MEAKDIKATKKIVSATLKVAKMGDLNRELLASILKTSSTVDNIIIGLLDNPKALKDLGIVAQLKKFDDFDLALTLGGMDMAELNKIALILRSVGSKLVSKPKPQDRKYLGALAREIKDIEDKSFEKLEMLAKII